jgi:hypothetical protein
LTAVSIEQQPTSQVLTHGVAISLDVAAPAVDLYLSYAGQISNQCGLKVAQLGAEEPLHKISDALIVTVQNPADASWQEIQSRSEFGGIFYRIPDGILADDPYGVYVRIKTKNHQNLEDLPANQSGELIVVSTPCSI